VQDVAGEWWVRSAAPEVICSTNFAPTGKVLASMTNSWMKSEFLMSAISSSSHPFSLHWVLIELQK
jgi:hypothetical protein